MDAPWNVALTRDETAFAKIAERFAERFAAKIVQVSLTASFRGAEWTGAWKTVDRRFAQSATVA